MNFRAIFDQSPLATAALASLPVSDSPSEFWPGVTHGMEAACGKRSDLMKARSTHTSPSGSIVLICSMRTYLPFIKWRSSKRSRRRSKLTTSFPNCPGGIIRPLFDHTTDKTCLPLSPAEAAKALLTLQAYKLGGLSGLEANYRDAPSSQSQSTCLSLGGTLFETLLLNFVSYFGDNPMPKDRKRRILYGSERKRCQLPRIRKDTSTT